MSGGIWLPNDEPVIRDVCAVCNTRLSDYDAAGAGLADALITLGANQPLQVPFNTLTLGWLIKTHINLTYGAPQPEGLRPTSIDRRILDSLIGYQTVPPDLYKLYVEGLDVPDWLWGDPYIGIPQPWTQVAGLEDSESGSRIITSIATFRRLNTLLALPADGDYNRFPELADALITQLAKHGFRWVELDGASAVAAGQLTVASDVGLPELRSRLRFVNAVDSTERKLTNVQALPSYELSVAFEDGVSGTVDVSRLIEIFPDWNDPAVFQAVSIDPESGFLSWPNDVRIAPDPFYEEVS